MRLFVTIALLLSISPVLHSNVSMIGSASLTDYYISGIIVNTDSSAYICGDEVKTSVTVYSGNLTLSISSVSLQITSPAGHVLFSGSKPTDQDGVARVSTLLPQACDVGVYVITVTGRGSYNSVSSEGRFSVNRSKDFISFIYDKSWYRPGETVDLTGRLVTNCNFTLSNGQVQLNVYGPDASLLLSTSQAAGLFFLETFKLPESTPLGLYQVVAYVIERCQNKMIYGNAFFSVLPNNSLQPWTISITLDKSTYGPGDPIQISAIVTGGPHFFCQFKWACNGNGTFPPINISIHVVGPNGTELYSRTKNVALYYYPPVYGLQEVFSGQVGKNFLILGKYFVTAEVSTIGYPNVQTATSFKVVPSSSDFFVSATPSSLSIFPSSSRSVSFAIDPQYGFDSEVDLSLSWNGKIPSNVTTYLYPEMNSTESRWVSILTISAGPNSPVDETYNLTVTGREQSTPNRTHKVEVQIHFSK